MIFFFGGAVRGIFLSAIFMFSGGGFCIASDMRGCEKVSDRDSFEEFGSCTIVAMPAWDKSKCRPCSLGRVELAWVCKPGIRVRVRIKHLEVYPKDRTKGVGAALFMSAVHFSCLYFKRDITIGWKAQPLEKKMSLDQLIHFYENLGGVVDERLDSRSASMYLCDGSMAAARASVERHSLGQEMRGQENIAVPSVFSSRGDLEFPIKDFRVFALPIKSIVVNSEE